MLIIAYYFSLLVSWQEHPLVVGPYYDWDSCDKVRRSMDYMFYDTDSCGLLPFPQEDAVYLEVGDIPKES